MNLHALVEAYESFGDHRVGTPADAATTDWLERELRLRGASEVSRQPFGFPYFDAQAEVRIGGQAVPSLPLYYQGGGEVDDDAPYTAVVRALDADKTGGDVDAAIAAARSAGARSAVLATDCASGELQAPNRSAVPVEGPPVLLVAGRHAEALRGGSPVQVRFSGRVVGGHSANLVARFGAPSPAPIVVATPTTGWFACAAERGTGIAIAIELAAWLGRSHAVLLVATPGHELLPHLGLAAYLESMDFAPALVVHLGANVALAMDGRLAPSRAVCLRADAGALARMRPALERLQAKLLVDPPQWFGEGAVWARHVSAPLVSFVGTGPLFHTPGDVAGRTTHPGLLDEVFSAIRDALQEMKNAP